MTFLLTNFPSNLVLARESVLLSWWLSSCLPGSERSSVPSTILLFFSSLDKYSDNYSNTKINYCKLCLLEKLYIIDFIDDNRLLNKRNEFISGCKHQNKYFYCLKIQNEIWTVSDIHMKGYFCIDKI